MTWRGCHAGRHRAGGLWHYCSSPGTRELDLEVGGESPEDADVAVESIGVIVCEGHYQAIRARPGAWQIDTEPRAKGGRMDDRPRVFASVHRLREV